MSLCRTICTYIQSGVRSGSFVPESFRNEKTFCVAPSASAPHKTRRNLSPEFLSPCSFYNQREKDQVFYDRSVMFFMKEEPI
ncbi:hypothetical protein HMPREF7215_2252 [Pyramidobacter piscolens W5455]|uniref:Uncharacterized protein n=1 Tax=Pyramidobacter piscolens W5455 TaxID=352165 RepID=A0ABM9ZTX8_9BACT|nr:hypothetical protein HMPREF7215_2252 [Pyramidobacter piscolens W5455]